MTAGQRRAVETVSTCGVVLAGVNQCRPVSAARDDFLMILAPLCAMAVAGCRYVLASGRVVRISAECVVVFATADGSMSGAAPTFCRLVATEIGKGWPPVNCPSCPGGPGRGRARGWWTWPAPRLSGVRSSLGNGPGRLRSFRRSRRESSASAASPAPVVRPRASPGSAARSPHPPDQRSREARTSQRPASSRNRALHNRGCSWGRKPPVSSSDLAM